MSNSDLLLFSEEISQIGPLPQFPPGQVTEMSRCKNTFAPQGGAGRQISYLNSAQRGGAGKKGGK